MQATASPSISFLLTFCTYQNPPHAIISPQKHNKQSHLSCKNYPLGIKFLLDRICLLKKMFSHSKHVWNLEWIFPFIKTLWIWRVGPRPPSQYLAVKPELPNKTRTDSSNDQGFPEDFLAFFVHSSWEVGWLSVTFGGYGKNQVLDPYLWRNLLPISSMKKQPTKNGLILCIWWCFFWDFGRCASLTRMSFQVKLHVSFSNFLVWCWGILVRSILD